MLNNALTKFAIFQKNDDWLARKKAALLGGDSDPVTTTLAEFQPNLFI